MPVWSYRFCWFSSNSLHSLSRELTLISEAYSFDKRVCGVNNYVSRSKSKSIISLKLLSGKPALKSMGVRDYEFGVSRRFLS